MGEFSHTVDRHVHEPCPECGLDMDVLIRFRFNGAGEANTLEVESVTERIDHKCVKPEPKPEPGWEDDDREADVYAREESMHAKAEPVVYEPSEYREPSGFCGNKIEHSVHFFDSGIDTVGRIRVRCAGWAPPQPESPGMGLPSETCPREDHHEPHRWTTHGGRGALRFCHGAW